MPIYLRNRATALERAGDLVAASGAWLAAAMGFYEEEAWDDASDCSARLREHGYDKAALDSLDGLIAYGRSDEKTAEALLAKLVKKGHADAPAAYVYGLMLASKGKRPEAIRAFRTAVELEPSRPIYRYRLAESLFMAGGSCADEIGAALDAAPTDGWTLNLAGQAALADGDPVAAAGYFEKAIAALPGEPAPAVNLSQACSDAGRHADAVAALGDWPARSSAAANRLGNALAADGRLQEAATAYRTACSLGVADVDLHEYRINLAAALIELGELAEAEDSLRRALETREDARSFMLMGDIATEYGDIGRAELAYRAALEREPTDAPLLERLVAHYLARHRYEKAEDAATKLEAVAPEAAAAARASIRAATVESLSCASCGRSWDVPKPTPAAPRATLRGEPPDESPAGSCPDCGKIFCVACRKDALADGRFTCPDCGARLNLNDDRIRWLVRESIRIANEPI